MKLFSYLSILSVAVISVVNADEVKYIDKAPTIDGDVELAIWKDGPWRDLSHLIVGTSPSAKDFSGRYKLRWNEHGLYLLAEIQDDHLSDTYANPLFHYWDDDCLELFIDADKSGGDHLNNYNAFAYHIALDNQVVDIGPDKSGQVAPRLYNEHIDSAWKRDTSAPHKIYWEVAIRIYSDDYVFGENANPVALKAGMKMGFMVAYCDSDGGDREHFLGSHDIATINGDKNLGYKDASVFGEITLIKP